MNKKDIDNCLKKLLVQAKFHDHIEVWIPFHHDVDLILLANGNLVKNCWYSQNAMFKKNHEYYLNVLSDKYRYVYDICKNQK